MDKSNPFIPLMVDRLDGVPYLAVLSKASDVGIDSDVFEMAEGVLMGREATVGNVDDDGRGGEKMSIFLDLGGRGAEPSASASLILFCHRFRA